VWNQHQKREWEERVQALESRALAMEGVLTRLPADAMVVAQLQNAGVLTLQETTTTAATRFASIKMTLITLQSTLITRSVQNLAQQNAALDNNLQEVRARLMKQVVSEAASAPGRNRQEQAAQLARIVSDTTELVRIVDEAKKVNQQQFEAARNTFSGARTAIAQLGAQITPREWA
jgi:L-lactate utilization protein LutC